jgi:hypothetical protein
MRQHCRTANWQQFLNAAGTKSVHLGWLSRPDSTIFEDFTYEQLEGTLIRDLKPSLNRNAPRLYTEADFDHHGVPPPGLTSAMPAHENMLTDRLAVPFSLEVRIQRFLSDPMIALGIIPREATAMTLIHLGVNPRDYGF